MNTATKSAYYEDVKAFCLNEGDYNNSGEYKSALPLFLNKEMVDTVGRALESAFLGWDRNEEQEHHGSLDACEASYFTSAFAEATGEWL